MSTLGEGVLSGASALANAFTGVFGGISKGIGEWWDGIFADKTAPDVPKMPELSFAPVAPEIPPVPLPAEDQTQAQAQGRSAGAPVTNTYTFHITGNFPNVKDGKDLLQTLNDAVADYGGGFVPA